MECAKHELLQPFNVLNEKEGEWNNEMPLMTLLTMKVLHMYLSLHAQWHWAWSVSVYLGSGCTQTETHHRFHRENCLQQPPTHLLSLCSVSYHMWQTKASYLRSWNQQILLKNNKTLVIATVPSKSHTVSRSWLIVRSIWHLFCHLLIRWPRLFPSCPMGNYVIDFKDALKHFW